MLCWTEHENAHENTKAMWSLGRGHQILRILYYKCVYKKHYIGRYTKVKYFLSSGHRYEEIKQYVLSIFPDTHLVDCSL